MVKIGKFNILTDFYVINSNGKSNLLLIQGRWALIDVMNGELTFHIGGELIKFQSVNALKVPPFKCINDDVKAMMFYCLVNTNY